MTAKSGVFICPSCQAVVKSEKPLEEGVICGECLHEFGKPSSSNSGKINQMPRGRSGKGSGSVMRDLTAKKTISIRAVGVIEAPPVAAKSLEAAKTETDGDDEMIMSDGTRRVRRRKKREKKERKKGLILFLVGWMCVIGIVFVLFKMGKIGGGGESTDKAPITNLGPLTPTEIEILKQSIPTIKDQFSKFLRYQTLSGREQFIDRSADLSLKFNRFYQTNPFPKPESELARLGANVLNFSDTTVAVESIWGDEKGNRWGAVHIFDKREGWKLDWEAFAPHSTESWSKFRSELGSKDGVFRLLVRRRRTSDQSTKVSLSFYRAPKVFEDANEYRNTESPEVDLLSESDLGKEFLSLWSNHLDGDAAYGSILGKALDPEGYLRITVRLAWEKNERDQSIMVLKEIVGTGWFGQTLQNLHAEALEAATEDAKDKLSEASRLE